MDADLRELGDLVKQTQPTARHKDAELEFALVFPDKRGMNVMRVVRLSVGAIGTWLSCSICYPSGWSKRR